jgi:hypothetical protein
MRHVRGRGQYICLEQVDPWSRDSVGMMLNDRYFARLSPADGGVWNLAEFMTMDRRVVPVSAHAISRPTTKIEASIETLKGRVDAYFRTSSAVRLWGKEYGLDQLSTLPKFTVDPAGTRVEGKKVYLAFSYERDDILGSTPAVVFHCRGVVEVDPERDIPLIRYRETVEAAGWKGWSETSHQYTKTVDACSITTQYRHHLQADQIRQGVHNGGLEITFQSAVRFGPFADSHFDLSAFGLSEPSGVERRWLSTYLWLALAGVLFLLAAGLVRWRQKRRAGDLSI